jgi:Na+/proline symporter
LVAALMSSLASLFNSSAMLFVEDFYRKARPNLKGTHYVFVGRVATAVIVVLGVVWIPVMLGLGRVLYEYLQAVQGLLAPAIASVFLLGVFWKRTTAVAAFWGLLSGFAIGMFRLALNVFYGREAGLVVDTIKYNQRMDIMTESTHSQVVHGLNILAENITNVLGQAGAQYNVLVSDAANAISDTMSSAAIQRASSYLDSAKAGMEQMFVQQYGLLYQIAAINWLHFAVLLFFFCILLIVAISLLTAPPTKSQMSYTLKGASTPEDRAITRASWNKWDVIHTIIILGIIVVFYWYFW